MDAKAFIDKHGVDVTATHMGDHTEVFLGAGGARSHEWRTWALAWLYTDEEGHSRLLVTDWRMSPTTPMPEGDVLEEVLYDLLGAVKEGARTFEEFVDEGDYQDNPRTLYRNWIAAVELRHRVMDWLAYQPVGEFDRTNAGIAMDRRAEFLALSREDADE